MKENENVEHQLILKHVYYFPNSEVNIISISELATLFPDERDRPDEEGTHIKSHRSKSTLTWNKGQYQRTFLHPDNKISEIPTNHGYTSFLQQ